jgi:hypothetical protein
VGTPPTAPPETPEQFVGLLAAAFRNADDGFLSDRLNPAVLARHGVWTPWRSGCP